MKVQTAEVTCEASPLQIEGMTDCGEYYYFRARHRTITLGIGKTEDDAVESTIIRIDALTDDRFIWSGVDVEVGRRLLDVLMDLARFL